VHNGVKKSFFWFFVAGFLNGLLVWMREQAQENDSANAHKRVPQPPDGDSGDPHH
jgi:hypothetical protein